MISSFGLVVTLYVPESVILEKLQITNESAKTYISGVEIVDMDSRNKVGNIEIKNSRIYTSNIVNVSGDIMIYDSTIHDLRIENTTGEVEIDDLSSTT